MLHLTGYGLTLDDLRAFRQWGSAHPGPPRGAPHPGRRGHDRAARPGLRQRRRHGHRRALAAGPLRRRACATTTRSSSAPTATSRRASATRPPRWPATSASAGSSTSTTTTTSPSTAPPSWRCPTTPAKRFEAYGWHVDRARRGRQRPRRARGRRCARAMAVDDAPSLIVLRSHIGYPSPKYTDTEHAHGNPLGEDEVAHHQGDPRPARRTRPSTCPTTCSPSTASAGRAGPRPSARRGRSGSTSGPATRAECEACLARHGPAGLGRRRCRRWEAGREGRHPQGERRVPRGAPARRRARPRRRRRRPHRQHRHRDQGPRRAVPRTSPAAARSTSASASTAWAA